MMYQVIDGFADLEDNRHWYEVGDVFPRKGRSVSPERIQLLLSRDNKAGRPLIKVVEEEAKPQVVAAPEKPIVRKRKPVRK